VQVAVLLSQPAMLKGPHSTFQFYSGALLSNGVLGHYFTRWSYVESCRAIGSPKLRNLQGLWWSSVEFASAIYIAIVVFLSWKGGRATRLLTAAALLSLAIGYKRSGALNEDLMCGSGGRYFFAFNVLIGLSLVIVSRHSTRMYSIAAQALVACSLISGIIDVKYIAIREHLPNWAQEVTTWRSDPDYRLSIRPDFWPGVKLTHERGKKDLPFDIYDTTIPGWQKR
jgi:peptidoglycan/LPS O-acetylase OafA/YrhL